MPHVCLKLKPILNDKFRRVKLTFTTNIEKVSVKN